MTDFQQMIDEIRSFLQSSDLTLTDRVRKLTEEYAQECRNTNLRLRRCDEYLAKGLRSEAIQFAQTEPVLLTRVAALDFPEWNEYHDMMLLHGLPEPPRLQLAIAEALNRAYAEEQPLEELLRNHRRLALCRAPLIARIRILRQLAKLDKQNPVWSDDIRQFENTYFNEVRKIMAGPAKTDPSCVDEAAEALRSEEWLTPPPAPLVKQVVQQAELLVREQLRLLLKETVARLQAAMVAGDMKTLHELRDQYNRLAAEAGINTQDELARRAAQPLNWLAKRERERSRELENENALAAFVNALDRQAAPEEVTMLRHKVLDLGLAVPPRHEERYQQHVTRVQYTRRWREIVISVAVLLAGLITLVVLFRSMRPNH